MNTMEYKGYVAHIEYDPAIEMFFGRTVNARDIVTFYGASVKDLKREFKTSLDDYLALCRERKIEAAKPYSGKFNLRLDPDVHARVAAAAAMRHMSLNSFVAEVLEEKVEAVLAD